jgi:polysaccharide export outer membrane protein
MNWIVKVWKPLGLGCVLALSLTAQDPAAPAKPDESKKADSKKADDSKKPADSKDAKKPDTSGKPAETVGAKGGKGGKDKNANLPPAPEMPTDLNAQAPYTVGVGDALSINVWKEPEVSGPVRIRGDCRITLPLIKDVEVCGMTPAQIQDLLVDKLGKFIAAPDVTVIPTEINSRKVYFIGNFRRTGAMVLNGPITIAQALSDAGGMGEYAKDTDIIITRDVNGKLQQYHFNYRDFVKGKSTKGNILLQPGDQITAK